MKFNNISKVLILGTVFSLMKQAEMVLTVTKEGLSFSLEFPSLAETKIYCAYLTCRQTNTPEIDVINGVKLFNIATSGSEIASMSVYKSYASSDGFELLNKTLANAQANIVISVAKQEDCKYGAYLCVVDYTNQSGSKKTNSAIVRSEATGRQPNLDGRVVFELQEKLSSKMSQLQEMLTRIETKVNVVDKTYRLVSKVLEEYHLLDIAEREWILTFRGTPFIDKSVYNAYQDGTGIPYSLELGCKTINSSLPCYNHYRNNSILDNWTNIKEVKFAIFQNNVQVHYVIFDGQGSNYMNWFTQKRILSSSWSDIKWKTTNYFSIEGEVVNKRRFFINHWFNGCPGDIGWFAAFEQNYCPYESSSSYPLFKFAKGNEAEQFSGQNTGVADMFAIFVKKNE